MRILGLDMGTKRIGVAISDALGITAQGVKTLNGEEAREPAVFIKNLILEKDITEIVVGLPLNMDGSRGPQAEKAILFARNLEEKTGLPVKLWDERMSTLEVERVMLAADVSRAGRKKRIDKLAAQVILQSYLDAKGSRQDAR